MKRLFTVVLSALALGMIGGVAVRGQECTSTVGIDYHVADINKTTEEVKSYDPKVRTWMVHATNDNYILYATSKKARDEWLGGWTGFKRFDKCDKIDPALDALAVAVKAKMGDMAPNANNFRFRDPASEKVMMTIFEDQKDMKVIKIGLDSATWSIQKDDIGLPSYRYKDGYIWARDVSEPEPSCHIFNVRVKQDYAGGGTYNRQIYRASALDGMTGCPK